MRYSGTFKYDLKVGEDAERWVVDLLGPGVTVEVKTDTRATCTGQVFVEYKSRGKASGIATTAAAFWVFKLSNVVIIVPTETLREVVKRVYNFRGPTRGGDNNTSVGVLVPVFEILKGAA